MLMKIFFTEAPRHGELFFDTMTLCDHDSVFILHLWTKFTTNYLCLSVVKKRLPGVTDVLPLHSEFATIFLHLLAKSLQTYYLT